MDADAPWIAVALGGSAALFALAVRRHLRARRAAEAGAQYAAWAARHPHVVALVREMGPLAPLLVAAVPDAVLRRWHTETGGGR